MKKASINPSMKGENLEFISQKVKEGIQDYYRFMGSHQKLRYTALEQRAEAMANEGNLYKERLLKEIRQRKQQRATARKIRCKASYT